MANALDSAPIPWAVLEADGAVKGPGCRQLAQAGRSFGPDHAVLETGIVGLLGNGSRDRPHAGAVGAERHHISGRQVLHALGSGVGPTRRPALQGIGDESTSRRKGTVVAVAETTVEEHRIPKPQEPVPLFPGLHVPGFDQGAAAIGCAVEQFPNIHDAGFPHKLPSRHLVPGYQAVGPGVGFPGIGGRHRMGRSVELGSHVLIQSQNIRVVGTERTDPPVVVDLKSRPGAGPTAGKLGGNHQGKVDEHRPRVLIGLNPPRLQTPGQASQDHQSEEDGLRQTVKGGTGDKDSKTV